ncbi:hypothetical protein KI387_000923, partial [Taxus chinensis]
RFDEESKIAKDVDGKVVIDLEQDSFEDLFKVLDVEDYVTISPKLEVDNWDEEIDLCTK